MRWAGRRRGDAGGGTHHHRRHHVDRILLPLLLLGVTADASLERRMDDWRFASTGTDELTADGNALTMEDFQNADRLTKEEIYADFHRSVDFVNGFRSDIRGPVADHHARHKRNGVSRPAKLWPNARIPYAISPHYTPHERALLARAVQQYHAKTCVRFVPRAHSEPDYLFIGKVDGCFSEVGRTSGVQVLSLDNGCMEYATIIHEMMHVIGFYHEHERWDRDNFIDIIWQNIDRGALDQFGKVDLSKTSYYGQPYDYHSILHYDSLAFSKNGFPTMLPKKKSASIGNAKDFSEIDLAKINRMYNCPPNKRDSAPYARAQSAAFYSPALKTSELGNGAPSSSGFPTKSISSVAGDTGNSRPVFSANLAERAGAALARALARHRPDSPILQQGIVATMDSAAAATATTAVPVTTTTAPAMMMMIAMGGGGGGGGGRFTSDRRTGFSQQQQQPIAVQPSTSAMMLRSFAVTAAAAAASAASSSGNEHGGGGRNLQHRHEHAAEQEEAIPREKCEDRITVCWWTQDRCRTPAIIDMMRTLCSKTCHFC